MCSSANAGVSLVEETGISVCTKDHVTGLIDDASQRIGSNVVKEEMDSLFCGDRCTWLVGGYGTECNQKLVVHRSCIVEQ